MPAIPGPTAEFSRTGSAVRYVLSLLRDEFVALVRAIYLAWLVPCVSAVPVLLWKGLSFKTLAPAGTRLWQIIAIALAEAGAVGAAASWLTYRALRHRLNQLQARFSPDQLTGFLNTAAIDGILAWEFDEARRLRRPLSVLLIHLDGLGPVHESPEGVVASERMLREFAARLRGQCRATDEIFRYNRDTVLVLAPATPADPGGRVFAERLRQYFSKTAPGRPQEASTSISAGVADTNPSLRPADTPAQLLQRAGQALNVAKAKGNSIEVYTIVSEQGRGA
jgi:diguanylate cyclase (GGDEF)-like protein